MKKVTQEELNQILQQHSLWLETEGDQGARADLSYVDLSGVNLSGVNLSGANLFWAALAGAMLVGTSLFGANLYGANLTHAQISADTRLHQCSCFSYLTCSPNALPWLILHPEWPQRKSTVAVTKDKEDNQK
jgi:hypothetical protein